MPGINSTGKPSTGDLFLGRGSVELALIDSTTGLPYDFRQVGNATAFTLNLETEKLEHQSSRSGVRAIDREIILQQKIGLTLTIDEVTNFENLANFLSGTATANNTNQASQATLTDEETANVSKGRSIDIRDSSGNRYYDISTTGAHLVVKTGTTGTPGATLILGTDYEVDYKWGTIFILEGASHTDGNPIFVTYTSQSGAGGIEANYDQVNMLTQSKVSAFLRFKAINPANNDTEILVDLHSVSLSADGDLALIGEEFAEMTLTGVAERNETGFPNEPVGKIVYHANA